MSTSVNGQYILVELRQISNLLCQCAGGTESESKRLLAAYGRDF
jgi:hypothetical protein